MHNSADKIRVAVIFGGRSAEHDVSCRSASSVFRFLDRDRYQVVPIRISRAGRWQVGTDGAEPVFPAEPTGQTSLASILDALATLRGVDVVFPVLHGPFGEDGTLQAVLEMARIPYVGSGVLASATAMDKAFTKTIVAAEGIPVADGVVLRGEEQVTPADRDRLGLPVFVKPARSGSSVGVSRVDDWDDLAEAIALARKHDTKVLVEAAVLGREVDMAVLQRPDRTIEVGPALEINHSASFFDFDAKYTPGAAAFTIPADLKPEHRDLLEDTARRVFEALGCAGLLRVDFFLTEVDGAAVVVMNEVNTLPGLTELSQFPQIWRSDGLSYPDLLDQLVSTAASTER
ncbi:D-alanine--D-alanine ligase family protein [Actinoplanes palleronii]|uniref:D-alanine--D-alanine ligase n=1 Tax=Actinoplanes palleronii TaxID=113570 RepID=A0ABQ4BNS9_9ACTN|nr:D-alanine--D-alanine ligase family protein [Actinoplanes palleronii]GIE72315.1 D-alanine--D-alanine ligase [Actinoplanes palleronii]